MVTDIHNGKKEEEGGGKSEQLPVHNNSSLYLSVIYPKIINALRKREDD